MLSVTQHWVKVGGGLGQDPASEVNHLRLNQPPINFFPVCKAFRPAGRSGFEAGSKCYSRQAHREGMLPQGSTRFFILPFWAASSHYFFFFHFPLHCLDSMNEHLGRIISNAFS